jgi:hypothetical protein
MKGRDYLISAEEKGKAEGKAERDIEITRRMLLKGKNIEVFYSGNIFSPIDNTSHKAIVASVPNVRTIRFRYPGI